MAEIVVVGGGGHAKVLISLLKKLHWDVIGYTDPRTGDAVLGVPCIGDDAALPEILSTHPGCSAAIGLGKTDVSAQRALLQRSVAALGFDFPVIVSPQAVVNEEVRLAAGTTVCDGAVVNSGTVTGEHCILNTNCTVEHDCRLGAHVHVAPGAVLGGAVTAGDGCVLGAGSTVIHAVTLCEDCLIGAGSTVVADIDEPGVYAGNPARRLR